MYRRLIILTVIIAAALAALAVLGYHAVDKWAEGLKWKRQGEFAEVAEQIRQDVKRKLDAFREREEQRPYTDYQYYYTPEQVATVTQQLPLLRSPLGGTLQHGLAYGHFQIESGGRIVTANDEILQREGFAFDNEAIAALTEKNTENVRFNLLPVIGTSAARPLDGPEKEELSQKVVAKEPTLGFAADGKDQAGPAKGRRVQKQLPAEEKHLRIESLDGQKRVSQRIEQQRDVFASNVASRRAAGQEQQGRVSVARAGQAGRDSVASELPAPSQPSPEHGLGQATLQTAPAERPGAEAVAPAQLADVQIAKPPSQVDHEQFDERVQAPEYETDLDVVEGKIEPFVPIIVGGAEPDSIFGRQVFLVRRVEIEDSRFWQGFKLNEKKLIEEVRDSANRFLREGMSFEILPPAARPAADSAGYAAILDFGFGELRLNLKEDDPKWAAGQIVQLRNWYLSIVAVVFLAAAVGLVSLWRYAHAQIKLAQKKDDFISAVSHELRTPLTSIRMYSEMLEKNWVKSEDKQAEYYRSMRQESERLSRLIENVLDFSRIQKGRKKYSFRVGHLNECVAAVVKMMRPYAEQNGFLITTQFGQLAQTTFDSDAIKQIVVNLVDNAIKYARDALDKTIVIRTRDDGRYIFIEVEDRGPGVPHRQRKKVFEEFYRLGSEATRETIGTGLGLALVRKFAEAHHGFVEILTAKPGGAVFRVALAVQS